MQSFDLSPSSDKVAVVRDDVIGDCESRFPADLGIDHASGLIGRFGIAG